MEAVSSAWSWRNERDAVLNFYSNYFIRTNSEQDPRPCLTRLQFLSQTPLKTVVSLKKLIFLTLTGKCNLIRSFTNIPLSSAPFERFACYVIQTKFYKVAN